MAKIEMDAEYSRTLGSRRIKYYKTLTAAKAREILRQAKPKMDPGKTSRINPILTLAQSHEILSGFSQQGDQPIFVGIAKNIIKEFGRFYSPEVR